MTALRLLRSPSIAAIIAVMLHVLMVALPAAAAPAEGSLLHALSIICSPDGQKTLDSATPAVENAACDHCTLCAAVRAPLPNLLAVVLALLVLAALTRPARPRSAGVHPPSLIGLRPPGQAPPFVLKHA